MGDGRWAMGDGMALMGDGSKLGGAWSGRQSVIHK